MTLFMLKFIIRKCIETEDRLVFALGLIEWEDWQLTAKGCRGVFFFFLGHENVLKLIVVMVAQLCNYTKNY